MTVSRLRRIKFSSAELSRNARTLEQFQEKCETVFRSELRQDKEIERLAVSVKR